ncbi:60S ribosomal protein L3 [Cordyceps fumosorosea ARSEF 2679]|uniref:Large ribosomal subunit protein mL44 n=1 Tax=Cordyceps fumosorosea (strain ARSEF 2679) TaxID=1081104 RepID=A0A162LDD1_CORFA|nr:60S ribosomal protein L3 [Cordyceps fumosorosea ARSEF 2679]OAA69014.1 60S ribosomal protein L3 [Cordyceps fumosorosea ARSEF 2679]
MKRLRVSQWSGHMRLVARQGVAAAPRRQALCISARCQSTTATTGIPNLTDDIPLEGTLSRHDPLPSPPPARALESAKLAALHARLALPKSIPLQTIARALVTPSADGNQSFNNGSLAELGRSIVNYHVLEYLVCKWPRLPIAILYEALRAFAGRESLEQVARRWGVDAAAAPGEEVDPGLLQWQPDPIVAPNSRWAYVRAEAERGNNYRRGMSSRVVLDDAFGDTYQAPGEGEPGRAKMQAAAYASFVEAVVGAIYTHAGADTAKTFVKSHILSRDIDLSRMFQFQLPTRELAMLCAREGFEPPRARLESETGRRSRTPVFIVGIYSGQEKLGEGAGASLDVARRVASMNALKAWYMYSPGNKVRVPSDMTLPDAKPWKAPHIDIGEII